jgi:ubiquinone/menaquinone biosynthesis C-methylase UbiE
MYTPNNESAYGVDIINMITYLNSYSGLEHFMNIGYADSFIEYILYPVGLSSKRLPGRLAQWLLSRKSTHGSILVVGCGRGGEAILLHELTGADIVGVDLTPFNIKSAERYAKKKQVQDAVTFLLGDACEMPVDSESVSCVFSCESAFHYIDKRKFIDESFRVLKKGGVLLVADIVRSEPRRKLSEEEVRIIDEFGRMLSAPGFFSLEEYKDNIKAAGFSEIIDCEVISRYNFGYLGAHSDRLIKMFTLLDKLPGFKKGVKRYFRKKNIDIDNFVEHSRTTAQAVKSKLVDYIIIGTQK